MSATLLVFFPQLSLKSKEEKLALTITEMIVECITLVTMYFGGSIVSAIVIFNFKLANAVLSKR